MKQFLQNIAAFTKRERRGAYVLLIVLFGIIILNRNIPNLTQQKPWFISDDSIKIKHWLESLRPRQLKLTPFDPNNVDIQDLIQMGFSASICTNWSKYLDAGGKFYSKSDVKRLYGMVDSVYYKVEPYLIIPQKSKYHTSVEVANSKTKIILDFNPNTYSYEELLNAGLSEKVATNIINYREKSSGYLNKKDLKKLYAVSDEIYENIEPHIIIERKIEEVVYVDSVELNSTTYEELVNLGISNKLASSILGYRNVLGGFYNHGQLEEVYNMDSHSIDILKSNAWIDTLLIRRINLNEIDEQKLIKHPYISKIQARKLVQYRNFASHVQNYQEIVALKIFPSDLASKLRVYFAF